MAASLSAGFNTPFQAQIDFFRQKLNLPTAAWNDIWQQAHDRAFIVAGAAQADLLNDLRQAITQAIASGTGLNAFRQQFNQIVAQRGWTGWTGSGSAAGTAWRTRVIYQTNMATSYAAGRWQQLTDPSMVQARPFWQYIHSDSVLHPRPLHKAWHGLTLAWDHPFWASHFPPNDWGCRCRVRAVAKPAAGDATTPPAGWDKVNPTTGAPPGIGSGFAYAPGATWHPNLDKYPFDIARQIVAANAKDGVFERWHQRIEATAQKILSSPEMSGLSNAEKINRLRAAIGKGSEYQIAVLNPDRVQQMGLSTQTVRVSEYDLVKQQVSRTGQDFGALDYVSAQEIFDKPKLMVRENDQMTIFVTDSVGKWYAAVLQQTSTGKGVYLKSLRGSSQRDALLQRKKGTVLIDALG